MVWAFEQYETFIAYNLPLSPFERAQWLVGMAVRTAHPHADLIALGAEEPREPISSLPVTHQTPVIVSTHDWTRRRSMRERTALKTAFHVTAISAQLCSKRGDTTATKSLDQ
jgi:hypothetical protein